MSKRKLKKKQKKIFIIFIILAIILSGYLVYKYMNKDKTVAIDNIKGYSYTLDNRDTDLMKDVFKELKKNLESKDIDYKKYAEDLAKLYVIDIYTLNNKVSKYDVGGLEYVHPDKTEMLKTKLTDSLYKYLPKKDKRKGDYPEVKSIEISNIKEDKYTYNDHDYEAYIMDASWTYKKDLEYDSSAVITVIKDGTTMYVATFVPEVAE